MTAGDPDFSEDPERGALQFLAAALCQLRAVDLDAVHLDKPAMRGPLRDLQLATAECTSNEEFLLEALTLLCAIDLRLVERQEDPCLARLGRLARQVVKLAVDD